jgi:hypothetical protein
MAKSTKALLTGRIQMCKTNPSIAHIGLATHGRSIQIGSNHDIKFYKLSNTASSFQKFIRLLSSGLNFSPADLSG